MPATRRPARQLALLLLSLAGACGTTQLIAADKGFTPAAERLKT